MIEENGNQHLEGKLSGFWLLPADNHGGHLNTILYLWTAFGRDSLAINTNIQLCITFSMYGLAGELDQELLQCTPNSITLLVVILPENLLACLCDK